MRNGYSKYNNKSTRRIMNKRRNPLLFAIIILLIVFVANINVVHAFLQTKVSLSNEYTVKKDYIVTFNANGGTGTMNSQVVPYNIATNLNKNKFTRNRYVFTGWNTKADGTGTSYTNEQAVTNLDRESIELFAQWREMDAIAKIGDTYYETLQDAIDAVPRNNTQTTIELLGNTSEILSTYARQNIVLDIGENTISNSGANPILENRGTLLIYNGTFYTTSTNGSAINNKKGGNLLVTGGKIIAEGTRQAIYNENGGVAEITGDAYLSATSKDRATVQNLVGGTMKITGGTIISNNYYGVSNQGNLDIGIKDGNADTNSPYIQAEYYGIVGDGLYNFYDGVIYGIRGSLYKPENIGEIEDNAQIIYSKETINEKVYNRAFLGIPVTITLDGNGGTPTQSEVIVGKGLKVGILPDAKKQYYKVEGWYTLPEGGEKITEDKVFTEDTTLYAHWEDFYVAQVGDNLYTNLQDAFDNVPTDGTETIVKILEDTSASKATILATQNVVLDIGNKTLRNASSSYPIIDNFGSLTIMNGTLTSSGGAAVVDNEIDATIKITGGKITATGVRQALYNLGTAEISGDAYLSAVTDLRGAVHNLETGTLTITGGTIISGTVQAVDNYGVLTIGSKDGNVNITKPMIQGATYGITSTTGFSIYDGVIKGKEAAIDNESNIIELEDGFMLTHLSELIGQETYNFVYLVEDN